MRTKDFGFMILSVDDNILYAEFSKPLRVDLEMAKDIVAQRLTFMEHKPHFLVGDFTNILHVSPDAKAFMQSEDGGLKDILAAAFIATNPLTTLLANIFIKTPKTFPARFFGEKAEAIAWIRHYRAQVIRTQTKQKL